MSCRRNIHRVFLPIVVCLLIGVPGCVRNPAIVRIRAENELVLLAPLINNAGLRTFPGWPRDTLHESVLIKQFSALNEHALIEYRRCEKLGRYRMVDDSGAATIFIQLTALPYRVKNDTLHIDVEMTVRSHDGTVLVTTTQTGSARVAIDPANDPFKEIGVLLSTICRTFPYHRFSAHFHSSR